MTAIIVTKASSRGPAHLRHPVPTLSLTQDDWLRRAELAVQKGEDDLAKEALKRRKTYQVRHHVMSCRVASKTCTLHACVAACARERDRARFTDLGTGRKFPLRRQTVIPQQRLLSPSDLSCSPPRQEQAESLKSQLSQQQSAVDNLLNNTRQEPSVGGSGMAAFPPADGLSEPFCLL